MANIFIYDELAPEDTAMLQALYSRSAESVTAHIEKVHRSGSGKFMESFYVGYGHASIADCGSTTIFIEGVSILADKIIQDWPLYSGQETSTRYIDMSKQPIIDPIGSPASRAILDRWLEFYTSSATAVITHLKEKYPKKPDEKETLYDKAIKARSFDILRGFLPAGITTQLSWHTNLRQAWDKVSLMRHHPLPEARDVAENILKLLQKKYAHSFGFPLLDDQENFREFANEHYAYYLPTHVPPQTFRCTTAITAAQLAAYRDLFAARPPKIGLPHFLSELGVFTFDFLLDFGSFRDLQRHRHGVCRMPLLTTDYGFQPWYLEQLPAAVRASATALISAQAAAIAALNAPPILRQYYVALGYNVTCRISYGLPAAVYVTELRSGVLVHPTLRAVAHQMHRALLTVYPHLNLHSDLNPDDWDIRRGAQDIVRK